MDAVIPCTTVRALARRAHGGTVLRTVPATATSAKDGLAVTVGGGRLRIVASRRTVLNVPVRAALCGYSITADASGMRVSRGGAVIAMARGLPVPEVSELATDAQGSPAATGLSVRLHLDDRYASHPGTLKTVLLLLELIALAATVLVAWRRWPGAGRGLRWPRWGPADAATTVIGFAWVGLGPLQYDDAWYALMARNASAAGYVGNYVYMFNVTESPFVASQYVAEAWGALGGWSLWWMRLLPLLYGLGTWVLLRVLLATALGRTARRPWVGWALLVGFLAWWLPYGLVLRPEPLIVLCSAAVLVLAELARRRRSAGALTAAAGCAALAVTVSPSGLVAFAPLPLALPWLWRWCRDHDRRTRLGAVLALIAATTVVVPIAFAVSNLADVVEAENVHLWYYVAYPWYDEWVHYQTLLGNEGIDSWGRRGPVLLTLAVLLVTAIASGRGGSRGGPLRELMLTSAVTTAFALVLLAFSPTKAILHFGAVAAPASVLLTTGLLRSPLPRRAGWIVVVTSVGTVVTAAVMTFAGPNLWHPYSDRGMPFGNHLNLAPTLAQLDTFAPHFGPVYVRSVWLWLGVAAVATLVAERNRRRRKRVLFTPERGVLVVSCTTVVAGMIAMFVYAPLLEYPGWTVASGGVEALSGNTCGLASEVTVLTAARAALGPPLGAARLTGDFALARTRPLPVRPPNTGKVWHDDVKGGTGMGGLTTPWYRLPAKDDATDVTVPVIGDSLDQQRLTVEFRTARGALLRRKLRPDPTLDNHTWQELGVPLPGTAVAVRVIADDVLTGPRTWLGVSQPMLTRPHPVGSILRGQPVFADQVSAALWPCVRQVTVADGITQAPTVRLLAGDGVAPAVLDNGVYRPEGGVWAALDDNATYIRLGSEMRSGGAPTSPWGNVEEVRYDHPVGLVDITVHSVRRAGWSGLPTLAGTSYAGYGFEDRPG
jgi:arabinosyltransferase B/arabinosyltransferase C